MSPQQEWKTSKCDKCGQLVPADNSALRYDIALDELNNQPSVWLLTQPMDRHLFPTPEGCKGSPSRVGYIKGWFSRQAKQAYRMIKE